MKLEDLSREELIDLVKAFENKKKYGLVWEYEKTREHFEFDNNLILPILSEVKTLRIKSASNSLNNSLIEGDNFYALNILKYTHAGQIDFIYIDPPYNTGNADFKYNDVFVDKEDSFRHSKWLNFMNSRLLLAKNLLTSEGVLAISIDNNEYANLKLLCDDIFGEKSFKANLIWKKKATRGGDAKEGFGINDQTEYILIYSKNPGTLRVNGVPGGEELNAKYKLQDENGQYRLIDYAGYGLTYQKSLDYEITNPKGIKIKANDVMGVDYSAGWRWSKAKYESDPSKIVWVKSSTAKGGYKPKTKTYKGDGDVLVPPSNLLDDKKLLSNTNSDLKDILGSTNFNNPKPTPLIKYLLQVFTDKNSKVLDFFAGSGTTGQAVLQINEEDGGDRNFILVTNNEDNICEEVTYPRLKKVMKGYKKPTGEKVDGLGGELNFFRIKFLKKSLNSDEMKIRLLDNCVDLLCFREGIFDEISTKYESYKLFQRGKKVLGIYNSFDYSDLKRFKKELDALKNYEKKVYVFTFDNSGLNPNDFAGWKDIELEPIPQKILEIIGALNA